MTKHYFNNLNYETTAVTFDIPHEARRDARAAWRFAAEKGTPLNVLLECPIPASLPHWEARLAFTRYIAHQLRVFAKQHGFKAAQLWVRTSDADTSANERCLLLVHVPDALKAKLIKIAANWTLGISVREVDYAETVDDCGKIYSTFNYMFSAASSKTKALEPNAWVKPAGAIQGPRTFCSRNLWTKAQIAHRESVRKAGGTQT